MIIDFPNIPEQRLPNFKGGEKEYIARMFFDGQNRIMYGRLEPGASIGLHTHETSSEIMYFLEGRGKVLLADGEERVAAGQCHYCPKGHTHSLVNDSDADVMTIVTATPKAVRKFIKGILLLHNLVKAQRNRLSAHGL